MIKLILKHLWDLSVCVLYNNRVISYSQPSVHDVLAIVGREFDVWGYTVLMPWIVEEVAGAVCGVDFS